LNYQAIAVIVNQNFKAKSLILEIDFEYSLRALEVQNMAKMRLKLDDLTICLECKFFFNLVDA